MSFDFHTQIDRLAKSGLLYLVAEKFANIDLHPETVSNAQMGAVFEELIRKFAEISNETAGEHFTPREVIRLMVNLLFIEDDAALTKPGVVRSMYDPTAGTGGMLSVGGEHLADLNPDARLVMYGQELNPESYAICKADMLIKGQDIARMIQFCQLFPDEAIVSALSTQLSWSHFMELLPIKDSLAREFYAEMCRIERWDVRTFRKKIGSLLFQRTALSKNTEAVISSEIAQLRDGRMTPEAVFRDPYILDFLGLKGAYSERDLETAILREIESVLLELGTGFAFVARQKRMSVGKDDFHLDLLFYHRHLRRLIAVELKLESFQPEHVGKMEFYLRWLDKHERAPGKESPLGLILCASADTEQVELLQLDSKTIRVSEYLTELPPLKLLQSRLHQAIEHAREQAARHRTHLEAEGEGKTAIQRPLAGTAKKPKKKKPNNAK